MSSSPPSQARSKRLSGANSKARNIADTASARTTLSITVLFRTCAFSASRLTCTSFSSISCIGNYVHTAFCEGREELNSIRRMYELMGPVMNWIAGWEKSAAYGGKKAIVNIGGIRGGHGWRASRTPEKTDLFLDVRVPPTIPMNEARRNVQQLFFGLEKKHPDWDLEFETYVSVPGAHIS